jgi:hypothetical protein
MNANPVTVSITRTVKAGCEADFERALHEFVQRSLPAAEPARRALYPPCPGLRLSRISANSAI